MNKIKLKTKLIGGFIIVAIITLVVGLVGLYGVSTVSKSQNDIGGNYLPSVQSLLTISQAQTEIDSAENFLLIPEITAEQANAQYDRISAAYKRAEDARKIYESTSQSPQEKIAWDKFVPAWDTWAKADSEYITLVKQYEVNKSPEIRKQMVQLSLVTQGTNFDAAANPLNEVITINKTNSDIAVTNGNNQAGICNVLTIIFMVAGTVLALVLGIFLGVSISKPLLAAVNNLSDSSGQVASASEELSSTSQQLASANTEQASSLEETSATLEESSSMIKMNSENTKQATQLAALTKTSADKGSSHMKEMINSMNEIKKSSDQVAKVIKVIDDIAFQTNILALNAAVEAARAGDAGMGFAVVAEEVRNLAQRSAQAAKDTAAMIETNIELSEKGVTVSQNVADSLSEITLQAKKVNELMDEISAASQEQTQGISQINKAIAQMQEVTIQNAATSEESAATAEELSAQAMTLNEIVQNLYGMVQGDESLNNLNVKKPVNNSSTKYRKQSFSPMPRVASNKGRNVNIMPKTHKIDPEDVIPLDFNKDDF